MPSRALFLPTPTASPPRAPAHEARSLACPPSRSASAASFGPPHPPVSQPFGGHETQGRGAAWGSGKGFAGQRRGEERTLRREQAAAPGDAARGFDGAPIAANYLFSPLVLVMGSDVAMLA